MFPQSPPRPPMQMPSRPPMMPPGMGGGGMPPGMGGGMPPGMPPGIDNMQSQGNADEAKVRELASMLEGLLQQLYQQFPFLNG